MKRIGQTTLALLSLVFLLGMVSMITVSTTDAKATNEKFEFLDVTFPDGTTGNIRANVKITNKRTTAVASYFSENDEDYLGQYQEQDGFDSTDPDEVLQWALDHYDDRQ